MPVFEALAQVFTSFWVTDAPVLATAIAHGALVSISCKNIYMVIFYTFSTIETKKKYFIFYGGP